MVLLFGGTYERRRLQERTGASRVGRAEQQGNEPGSGRLGRNGPVRQQRLTGPTSGRGVRKGARADGQSAHQRQYGFLGRPANALAAFRATQVRETVHRGPALSREQVVTHRWRRAALQVRASRPHACEHVYNFQRNCQMFYGRRAGGTWTFFFFSRVSRGLSRNVTKNVYADHICLYLYCYIKS